MVLSIFHIKSPQTPHKIWKSFTRKHKLPKGAGWYPAAQENEEITCQDITVETVQILLSPFHLERIIMDTSEIWDFSWCSLLLC